jgi:hypothetical protein
LPIADWQPSRGEGDALGCNAEFGLWIAQPSPPFLRRSAAMQIASVRARDLQ